THLVAFIAAGWVQFLYAPSEIRDGHSSPSHNQGLLRTARLSSSPEKPPAKEAFVFWLARPVSVEISFLIVCSRLLWAESLAMYRYLLRVLLIVFSVLALTRFSYSGDASWVEVTSPHFSVVTDAGEKRGREVAIRFEQMRAVYAN